MSNWKDIPIHSLNDTEKLWKQISQGNLEVLQLQIANEVLKVKSTLLQEELNFYLHNMSKLNKQV